MATPAPAIAEIASLITAEVAAGLLASREMGLEQVVRVDDIVVRTGQPAAAFTPGTAAWQVEMRLGDLDVPQPGRGPGAAVPPVLAKLGAEVLAGAGPIWASRLAGEGVHTVGDAVGASVATIDRVAARYGPRARRFFGRARGCALHLPPEPALPAGTTVGACLRGAGPSLPGAVARMLDDLVAAIDLPVLDRIALRDLWV